MLKRQNSLAMSGGRPWPCSAVGQIASIKNGTGATIAERRDEGPAPCPKASASSMKKTAFSEK